MNIYILPAGPEQFPDEYFKNGSMPFRPFSGGNRDALFWKEVFPFLTKRGVVLRSYKDWKPDAALPDDALLILNHPGEPFLWRLYYYARHFRIQGGFLMQKRNFLFKNYKNFRRRILIQLEPPV